MDERRYKQIQWNKRKKRIKNFSFGCFKFVIFIVAICVLWYVAKYIYYKADGLRFFHGQVEIAQYFDGEYYLNSYNESIENDKKYLKQILAFFCDTIPKSTNIDGLVNVYKHKSDYKYDDGRYYFDENESFTVCYCENDSSYFKWFHTWSEMDFETSLKAYTIEIKDSTLYITFDYENFNTDVWQKFLCISDCKMNKETSINRFELKNPNTKLSECIIIVKRFENGSCGFKMEIL